MQTLHGILINAKKICSVWNHEEIDNFLTSFKLYLNDFSKLSIIETQSRKQRIEFLRNKWMTVNHKNITRNERILSFENIK